MKEYHLTILHHGMNRYTVTILADGYWEGNGCYGFYQRKPSPVQGGTDQNILICSYPICNTIIESIE